MLEGTRIKHCRLVIQRKYRTAENKAFKTFKHQLTGDTMNSKQVTVLQTAAAALATAFVQHAMASDPYPEWWDNYQHRTSGTYSTTLNSGVIDTNSIYVANDENLNNKKLVFVEVDWTEDKPLVHPDLLGANIVWPINNSTGQAEDAMSPAASSSSFILDSNGLIIGSKHKAFFSYTIPIQPAFEYVDFKWGLESTAGAYYPNFTYTYDIRTTCVPEPDSGVMMMCGVALLGLVSLRRKGAVTQKPL